MADELDEIMAYLEYIRSQNRPVSIVNTFKGVSYSLIVNIDAISKKEKTISVSSQHRKNISLLPNTNVAIHSDLFPHTVLADVVTIDVQWINAILKPLEYRRGLDDNRSHVRVQTREDIPITIECKNDIRLSANIHDISTDGVSIVFNEITKDIEEISQVGRQSRLHFEIQLSNATSPHVFNFAANTVYVTVLNENDRRVGFQIFPSQKDLSALRRYIFDRQTELFQEISSQPGSKE
jgi:hypothetical protein